MASMFSFGFSGDDIEVDLDDAEVQNDEISTHNSNSSVKDLPELFPAGKHSLEEWITSLPSQIAYNTLNLGASATTHDNENNISEPEQQRPPPPLAVGRREIFDVRTQLMAEDAPEHEALIAGLEEGDLKPNFYEGGFKTWECAIDLAKLVTTEGGNSYRAILDGGDDDDDGKEEKGGLHVVELGCGTAVPTLALFAQLLSQPKKNKNGNEPPSRKIFRFTLADYNSTVLRMVTLPNLLLTWWLNTPPSTTQEEDDDDDENAKHSQKPVEGELDIDSTLLDAFRSDLSERGIIIDFVSGAWSPRFVDLVLGYDNKPLSSTKNYNNNNNTLILASETIYSPSSLGAFSETLTHLLRKTRSFVDEGRTGESRSLIAAKKVYFGVGGGIDEFLHVLRQQPLQENERVDVREVKEVTSEGVGRIVLEVSIHNTTVMI